jgi:hypothetical protein
MALAFWAIRVRPQARRSITLSTIALGAAVALAASHLALVPSFEVGPAIGSGRIERPDYGFALTFPDSWTVQAATPEGVQSAFGDLTLEEGETLVLAAERMGRTGICVVRVDDPSARRAPTLLNPVAAATERQLIASEAYDRVERVRIDLPVGPAWRIDRSGGTATGSFYFIRGRDALYFIDCSSDDPPDDHWLSIAETFEFSPDPSNGSMPSSPVLGSGRIVRSVEGFALTFPDDWVAEEVTPENDALLFPDTDPRTLALQPSLLFVGQAGTDAVCRVDDLSRLAHEPPAWRGVVAATLELGHDAATDFVDLPAGQTGRISSGPSDGTSSEAYVYTDGETFIYLTCQSQEPPADDWLSIAETFEWLSGAGKAAESAFG